MFMSPQAPIIVSPWLRKARGTKRMRKARQRVLGLVVLILGPGMVQPSPAARNGEMDIVWYSQHKHWKIWKTIGMTHTNINIYIYTIYIYRHGKSYRGLSSWWEMARNGEKWKMGFKNSLLGDEPLLSQWLGVFPPRYRALKVIRTNNMPSPITKAHKISSVWSKP